MCNYQDAMDHLQRALSAALLEGDLLLAANISRPIDLAGRALGKVRTEQLEESLEL